MKLSVQADRKYQLRDRKSLSSITTPLRSSNRTKTSVSYVETDDNDDSDYEPTPKRARNTNVGLCEPFKSRLLTHARSTQVHDLQTAKGETLQTLPVLPADSDRNKKCPYCETSFYYEKSIGTHIEHAHSDRLHPKSAPMLGTNSTSSLPPDTSTPVEDGVLSINTEGTMPTKENVMGKNPNMVPTPIPNTDNSTKGTINTPNIKPPPGREVNMSQPSNTGVLFPSKKDISGHHKHRPKPKGKHLRPMPPVEQDKLLETPVKPAKSAFITMTHSIRMIKKCCHYKCKMCVTMSDS